MPPKDMTLGKGVGYHVITDVDDFILLDCDVSTMLLNIIFIIF